MFIGIVVGIVPLLYLYFKQKLVDTEPEKRLSIIYISSVIAFVVIEYISLTAYTHEYVLTGVVSILFGILITKFIYNSVVTSKRIEEEEGLVASFEHEKHNCLAAFVFFIVVVILKLCLG